MATIKHFRATLSCPLEMDLDEDAVREILKYDKKQILMQEDWDNACISIIKEVIEDAHLPVHDFNFTEVKKDDIIK